MDLDFTSKPMFWTNAEKLAAKFGNKLYDRKKMQIKFQLHCRL